jgi:ribosomal protein S18 acetylase RimI-like enzyme
MGTGVPEERRTVARVAPLTPEHRLEVEAILGAFGPEARGPGPRHPPSVPRPDSDDEYLGAFDAQGRLIGYACFGSAPATDRGYDLYWIAVHPQAQHTGCGTVLLDAVERRLRELNARLAMVDVSSRPDHAPIRAFYTARHYNESARLRGFYTPTDDRLVLTKRFQAVARRRGGAAGELGANAGAGLGDAHE